jgi:hypothetical protein
MRGTFSEDALLKFSELVSVLDTADFSEAETYDFTRCVRPDGSAYGTKGKCRKGSEQAKDGKAAAAARAKAKFNKEEMESPKNQADMYHAGLMKLMANSPTAKRKLKEAAESKKPKAATKATTGKSPSAKERQANPGKETFDKGVRDRRENRNAADKPKEPKSDGPARAAYLKQTLDNEIKRQNRPEIVAGLKKKLAEAEKENLQ